MGWGVSGYMCCPVPLQEHRKAFQEMWLGFLKHKVGSGGWKHPVWGWGVGERGIAP